MARNQLPSNVAQFIRAHIDSVEQLEILILLRLKRERTWTAAEIASEMRTAEGSASSRLATLVAHGLVARQMNGAAEAFRYSVEDIELERDVGDVVSAYVVRRYAVIDAIFAQPTDKISLFAEAFRLRKKDEDDDG